MLPRPGLSEEEASARTRRELKALQLRRLERELGPHYADADVRLYVKQRERNERRGGKRGNFPEDDALPKLGTFGKLAPHFQEVIRE